MVSCLNSTGAPVNFTTGQFPATTGLASAGGGDSTIETDVTLAQPCFAPIVFVTNGRHVLVRGDRRVSRLTRTQG